MWLSSHSIGEEWQPNCITTIFLIFYFLFLQYIWKLTISLAPFFKDFTQKRVPKRKKLEKKWFLHSKYLLALVCFFQLFSFPITPLLHIDKRKTTLLQCFLLHNAKSWNRGSKSNILFFFLFVSFYKFEDVIPFFYFIFLARASETLSILNN